MQLTCSNFQILLAAKGLRMNKLFINLYTIIYNNKFIYTIFIIYCHSWCYGTKQNKVCIYGMK